MQFGPNQIHTFTSVMLILGAVFVALICDLLKGHNEQLRELAIELKVRREEEHKRFQMLAPHTAPSAYKTEKAVPKTVATPAARVLTTTLEKKRPAAPEARAAMERGERLAGTLLKRQPRVEQADAGTIPADVISKAAAATSANADATRRIRMKVHTMVRSALKPGVLDAAVAERPAERALPAGFQDAYVLTRLVGSHQPVSGLVVSIGLSAQNDQNGALAGNVSTFIQSLIGPNDFAAQSGKEEFLLIYPGDLGAAAQRRLSRLTQQLRDFQLGSPGNCSILFSWGGVEARSESIHEAIASATDRMEETRRVHRASENALRRAM